MGEHDPIGVNGHHLLPLEFKDEFTEIFAREGEEFDKHEYCSALYAFQHLQGGIHPGWNADWQTFFDEASKDGHQLTVDDVLDHMHDMREEYEIDDHPIVHYNDTHDCDPFDGVVIDYYDEL